MELMIPAFVNCGAVKRASFGDRDGLDIYFADGARASFYGVPNAAAIAAAINAALSAEAQGEAA